MSLTKEQILAAQDIVRELLEIPEWGGDVYVQSMSGAERDKFEASIVSQKGKNTVVNLEMVRARLASYCVVDEDGTRLFNEKDILALSKKSASALQKIFVVARRLSAIGEEDIQELTEGLQESPLEDSVSV